MFNRLDMQLPFKTWEDNQIAAENFLFKFDYDVRFSVADKSRALTDEDLCNLASQPCI